MDAEKNTGINFFVQADSVNHALMKNYARDDATMTAKLFAALPVERMMKTTKYFEQAIAAIPLFAEMCKRAKFADHDGYLTLELETADTPEGKFIGFVEAGDSMYELLEKMDTEWGEG